MPKFLLNKLVRHRLPEMYKELGEAAEVEELIGKKLQQAIVDKISEEAAEIKTKGSIDPSELADLLQLIDDASLVIGMSRNDIERLRKDKEEKKGACVFVNESGDVAGYYIKGLVCDEDDKWTAYYRKDPALFPEIPDEENS